MAEASEEEKIRIELEVPKKQVQIESISSEPSPEEPKKARQEAQEQKKAAEKKVKEAKEITERSQKKEEKSDESEEGSVASYKPSEIAKAPVDTPEPEDKRGPNSHQKTIISFGIALAVASIALWPLFSFWIFVAVAVAAAAVVAFGSLVRV